MNVMRKYDSSQKIIMAALLVVLMFFVGSSITGYTTSLLSLQQQIANASLASDLERAETELEECDKLLNSTSSLFAKCKSDLLSSRSEVTRLTTENLAYEKNVTELRKELKKWNDAFKNSANDICCIRRVVNADSSIRYFYILDDKIYCTNVADASLGTAELSCP